ncbi:MAG: 16S rRNA processing protein RimM [Hyphomicrobiales bacterium]|nr:16S rRNA processing protein RimM [Hyphomicrobiales bacterium]
MSQSLAQTRSAEQVQPARVCLGVITGARGLKGDVWVRSFTSAPENIAAYGAVSDETGSRRFHLHVTGAGPERVSVRVDGIDDRTAAEALKGIRLYVPRSVLPPPDDDEFYFTDLIGLDVYIQTMEIAGETPFGHVRDVQDYGAGAVLDICESNGRSSLVPFTRQAVPIVDLAQQRIVIAPLPGLVSPDELAGDAAAERGRG